MKRERSGQWLRRFRRPDAAHQGGGEPLSSTTSAGPGRADEPQSAPPPTDRHQAAAAERTTSRLLASETSATADDMAATTPGPALSRRSPFLVGFLGSLGVLTGWGLVLLVGQLGEVVGIVVVAAFLALGLEPAVVRLVQHGVRRGWAVLLVVLGVLAVLAGFVWIIVPPIVAQADQLVSDAPSYITQLQHSHWFQALDEKWDISNRIATEARSKLTASTFESILGGVLGVTETVVNSVATVITTLVLSVLLLATMPTVKTAAYMLVPASRRPRVMYLSEEILSRVGAYMLGQVVVAVVNGAFCYVLAIVLGLPFPVIISLTVGLLALVPIVGTVIGGVLVTTVALTQGVAAALIALTYFVVYHLLETYVISPRIMRRAVEAPPLVTIIAVLAGSAVAGVLGAVLAIPVVAGVLLLTRHVVVPRQQRH